MMVKAKGLGKTELEYDFSTIGSRSNPAYTQQMLLFMLKHGLKRSKTLCALRT